jgi:hypothetical protein
MSRTSNCGDSANQSVVSVSRSDNNPRRARDEPEHTGALGKPNQPIGAHREWGVANRSRSVRVSPRPRERFLAECSPPPHASESGAAAASTAPMLARTIYITRARGPSFSGPVEQ